MFRLIRAIVLLLLLVGLGVAAVTVPLGKKTLWEHLQAIAQTEESQELVDGVKERARDVLQREAPEGEAKSERPAVEPQDNASPDEQERLRKLIRGKLERKDKRGALGSS